MSEDLLKAEIISLRFYAHDIQFVDTVSDIIRFTSAKLMKKEAKKLENKLKRLKSKGAKR